MTGTHAVEQPGSDENPPPKFVRLVSFEPLARLISTWPAAILAGLAVITLVAAAQLPKLHLDTSAEGVLLNNDPERAHLDELSATFGLDEILIVAVNAQDVLAPVVLRSIDRLTEAFWEIDGIVDVISLTSTRDIVGSDDGFSAPLLVPSIPKTPEAETYLHGRALGNPIYEKHLISSDGKTAAINVFLDIRPDDRTYRAEVVAAVEKLIAKETAIAEMYVVGIPKTKVAITEMMISDLVRLTPITMIVLAALVYLCFGTLRGVLLPLLTMGLSLVWTFGLMARLGTPVSIVITVLPSLVMMVGTSYVMYIVSRYYENAQNGGDSREITFRTLSDIAGPVTVSGVTTACGIAALAINDVTTVKDLGLYGAFGVLSTLTISLSFVPAWRCSGLGRWRHRSPASGSQRPYSPLLPA